MGIDVAQQTEDGTQAELIADPRMCFPALLDLSSRTRGWRLLQYIDPYGDTVFNQLQLPDFASDLAELRPLIESEEDREFLYKVLDLVNRTIGQTHIYIALYGD